MGTKTLAVLESLVDHLWKQGYLVLRVVIKNPLIEPLMILTVRGAKGNEVAFIGGRDIEHCARKAHDQVLKGTVKWREDRYAQKEDEAT